MDTKPCPLNTSLMMCYISLICHLYCFIHLNWIFNYFVLREHNIVDIFD